VGNFQYDDSPHRLDEYVSVDELTGLIEDEGKVLRKDTKRLIHFLTRVRNTLLAFRQQVQNLHKDVQAANIRATSIGTPTSLDPRSAARFLPPEEIAALADELIKEKLAALSTMEEDLTARRADLLKRLNSVKFVVETLAEDYSIPDDLRAKIVSAFAAPLDSIPTLAPTESQPVPAAPPDSGLDDLFS